MNANATVLVGTDGSESADIAVRWATQEAERRDGTLRIICAFDPSWTTAPLSKGRLEAHAEATLSAARAAVHEIAPHVPVETEAVAHDPVEAILHDAAHAALAVVGNRGRGGFASLLLGSVGQRVATHAPCSVAVVRGRANAFEGPVIVGLDGPEANRFSLTAAFAAAAARRAPVLAVHAYHVPMAAFTPGMPILLDPEHEVAAAADYIERSLRPWRDKFPDVPVETQILAGGPARLLVGFSHLAQLLVVGTRGHGVVGGTLLGSVGLQLLHHAECPVLIARG